MDNTVTGNQLTDIMISALRRSIRLCVVLSILFVTDANEASSDQTFDEYDLKIAYLYNFTKFIRWPEDSFSSAKNHFNICIQGELPPQKAIQHLENQHTRGYPLNVVALETQNNIEQCHILYFRNINVRDINNTLKTVSGKPILTVSDTEKFAVEKGVIQFAIENEKIRLLINHKRAKDSGISISAQLLEIASVVRGEGSI